MAVRVVTYGGSIGWFLRKHMSSVTSWMYLETQYLMRKRLFREYERWFEAKMKEDIIPQPCLISIETINRCNSTCDFCPANRNEETRPFMKMDDDLFFKIINDLHEWDYSGYLNLYVNNEPLMDKQIEERYEYAKRELPNAKMLLYTNGLLLNKDRFIRLANVVDKMIINNYSETIKLHRNIGEIVKLAKEDKSLKQKDITIQIRYIHEILTNRAGAAPNKKRLKEQHKICIMPYTDMTIYPDGKCGLCCSDVLEKTNLGNIKTDSIQDIWTNQRYAVTRSVIGRDREEYAFCKGCDFVDAGIRNGFISYKLKNDKAGS